MRRESARLCVGVGVRVRVRVRACVRVSVCVRVCVRVCSDTDETGICHLTILSGQSAGVDAHTAKAHAHVFTRSGRTRE
jgi:hypothetical protein